MKRSPRTWLAIPFAAALLVVGCSSGDDDADTTTTTEAVDESTTTTADGSSTTTGGDPATTTTEPVSTSVTEPTPTGGDDELCEALQDIRDYDVEASEIVTSGEWPAIQDHYVSTSDRLIETYDEAIALDTDLSDELETLKAVAVATPDLAAASSGIEDFADKLTSDPSVAAAGPAALALNSFSESTCGFSTGGN